jgi:hypothetical protein
MSLCNTLNADAARAAGQITTDAAANNADMTIDVFRRIVPPDINELLVVCH